MKSTGPDFGTVLRVLERDSHACVRCGVAARGERGRDWVLHHRRPRRMGGSRQADTNQPQNLVTLCVACHEHIESHRIEAYGNGWLVTAGDDPCAVRVLIRRRRVFLTNQAAYADGLT